MPVITLGGGLVMLTMAATAHRAASVPLLVIGGAWTAIGVAGRWQSRRLADEIVLNGNTVEFRAPARTITVPASEIVEVRQSRWDGNRIAPLRFLTRSGAIIKTAPRLHGTFDFLVELRRANPDLTVNL